MKLLKSGLEHLKTVSSQVNEQFKDVPNNCLLVAETKKRIIGRGKIKTVKIPKRWNATKTHVYLEVDGYILDSGLMKQIILD